MAKEKTKAELDAAKAAAEAKKALEAVQKAPIIKEFQDFVMRGNVVDLAVGVIIGGAFGSIVTSLVDDILMPILGVILNGVDFSGLSFTVKDAVINYGLFIQNVVDFLIVAVCIFFIVKALNAFTKKQKAEEEAVPKEPSIEEKQLKLLEEINRKLGKK